MSVLPLGPLLPPPLFMLTAIIRIRRHRTVSVAGKGRRTLIAGGIILEDPETRQVLRYDTGANVYHRIVIKMHFAERSEVLEILV